MAVGGLANNGFENYPKKGAEPNQKEHFISELSDSIDDDNDNDPLAQNSTSAAIYGRKSTV